MPTRAAELWLLSPWPRSSRAPAAGSLYLFKRGVEAGRGANLGSVEGDTLWHR